MHPCPHALLCVVLVECNNNVFHSPHSTSRPGTRLSKSGDLPSERFTTPTPQPGPNPNFPVDPQEKDLPDLEDDSSAESSEETEASASGSSLSKLSSARGFSPENPVSP